MPLAHLRRRLDGLRRLPLRALAHRLLRLLLSLAAALGIRQRPERLEADAQRYWTGAALDRPSMAHWRGEGGLPDDEFEALGAANARRVAEALHALRLPDRDLRILEWGCGGGANLGALADRAAHLVGVDLTEESLAHAAAEVARRAPGTPFAPIRIDVAHPERALAQLDEPVDVAICVNVLELVPTPAHGLKIVEVLRDALRPGGMALVQFRYPGASRRTTTGGLLYARNVADMTTYAIEEMWTASVDRGLEPRSLALEPAEAVIGTRYAYLVCQRP